ncbi:MAG: hypothetical protein ACKVOK_13670, partial [Flavobacteriales bacterium]
MALQTNHKFVCSFLSKGRKSHMILKELQDVLVKLNGRLITLSSSTAPTESFVDNISKSNMIFIDGDLTEAKASYTLGLAIGFGKPVIALINEDLEKVNEDLYNYGVFFSYSESKEGLETFSKRILKFLSDFIRSPSRFRDLFPKTNKISAPTYFIDIDSLDPLELDNMCFELISQMGFKKVNWGVEFKEFDLVATLPKKDPDGYEYDEVWFVSTGNKTSIKSLLDFTFNEPGFFLNRLLRDYVSPNLFSKPRIRMRSDALITFLFILRDNEDQKIFERGLERSIERTRYKGGSLIRFRTWDTSYLTNLIQTYPQIAYKYFSQDSNIKSKNR